MSLLKIVANDIELDFVKESLSIKKENNALSRDFKVSYSSYPFLIIENGNTKKALGTRDLASINKSKITDVIVFEGGKKYQGQLQVLTFLSGFRKCNLKYSSELLSIMNTKISAFMPIVSVIPDETTPETYVEESLIAPIGSSNWDTYPLNFIEESFPNVKWQFPTMSWKDKFGTGLETTDDWFKYQGEINRFEVDFESFVKNYFTENEFEILDVLNQNVASPQVYLLAPLYYAAISKGFKPTGNFYTNSFISRLLFQSSKNNLTKVTLNKVPVPVVFSGLSSPVLISRALGTHEWTQAVSIPTAGTYKITYSFLLEGPKAYKGFGTYNLVTTTSFDSIRRTVFKVKEVIGTTLLMEGTHDIEMSGTGTLYLKFQSFTDVLPTTYSLSVSKDFDKHYYQMHPTIQLGRYLPDWTFGTYLNELQNLFNLDINIDDFTKRIEINFNEEFLQSGANYNIKKSLLVTGYEQTPVNAFLLKYANDEDAALWITSNSLETYVSQSSDFLEKLESKFKIVPTTYTAVLSEELESKTGVGLMIYNPEGNPYISDEFSGQTLKMEGVGGIYDVFFKKWLKFRFNASAIEMEGPFSETEINKMQELKRLFIDNQEYIVSSFEYSETINQNFILKLSLLNVNL